MWNSKYNELLLNIGYYEYSLDNTKDEFSLREKGTAIWIRKDEWTPRDCELASKY